MFIAFEGIDGSGTTTQTTLLAQYLRERFPNRNVVETREPYSEEVEPQIRKWLKESPMPHIALLAAFNYDRHLHMTRVVRPALAKGDIVVSDRQALSTLVYQSEHNDPDLVWALVRECEPKPIYVVLDVPAEVAAQRMLARGGTLDGYETDLELQRRLRRKYLLEARTAVCVNAEGKPPQEVHRAVVEQLSRYEDPRNLCWTRPSH